MRRGGRCKEVVPCTWVVVCSADDRVSIVRDALSIDLVSFHFISNTLESLRHPTSEGTAWGVSSCPLGSQFSRMVKGLYLSQVLGLNLGKSVFPSVSLLPICEMRVVIGPCTVRIKGIAICKLFRAVPGTM